VGKWGSEGIRREGGIAPGPHGQPFKQPADFLTVVLTALGQRQSSCMITSSQTQQDARNLGINVQASVESQVSHHPSISR